MARSAAIVTAEIEAEVEGCKQGLRKDEPGRDEQSADWKASIVMLTAMSVGTKNLSLLSRATGVAYPEVRRYAKNLRTAGIWTEDGKIEFEYDLDEDAFSVEVEFRIHLLVALGHASKMKKREASEPAPTTVVKEADDTTPNAN